MAETLRGGRFRVLRALGRGSQGETFEGVDTLEQRAVAIKRFDVRGAKSWKDVELAEREARVLQSLSHPKLPGYIDHFESDGVLYLVMEKIEGESLASLHARGVVLGEQDIVRLLTDASEVLDYLHGRAPPVIHRDLKPGNVIRRPDGSFAFVDFGAVRDRLRQRGGSTVVGTFGYMAPEQFQGRALPASDVYAIGATAVAMLTGREPEDCPHRGLALDVHAALQGLATPFLTRILEHMLTPDPEERAERIAPLLVRAKPGRVRPRPERSRRDEASWDLVAHARWERVIRKEQRRAERRAMRQAHRQTRRAMNAYRHGGSHPIPRPVTLVLVVCFAVAMLAVTIATRLVVPVVLQLLALFFARPALRRAADSVRRAGQEALTSMAQGRRTLLAGGAPPVEAPLDVRPTRVSAPEAPETPEEEPSDELLESESATAKH
jgi:protein kinase-like protein